MYAAILAVILAAIPPVCPNPKRSDAQVQKFKAATPCPKECRLYVREGSKFTVWRECGRCAVDHVCPLACQGKDDPSNMQWLKVEDNLKKGADCSACNDANRAEGCSK